jgi:hypothetical protein
LYLSGLDSITVRTKLDSVVAARKKPEVVSKKKKNKSSGGSTGGGQSSALFNQQSTATSDWYFGNPSAVASGQTEFQRIWGRRPLEDNWRRSNKTNVIEEGPVLTAQNTPQEGKQAEGEVKAEIKTDEVGELIAKLPRSEKQKQEALAKIEDGYFHLGDLYYLQLGEKQNAEVSYKKLLSRFPESEFAPEVLYKLYLITGETNKALAEQYATQLKEKYPASTFTRILINPDYLRETSVAAEKQKLLYKEAYEFYQVNNLRAANEKLSLAFKEGETNFTPQLEMLKILITGKTEDVTRYQYELGEYIKKYPDGTLKPYAEQLLAASKTLIEKQEKAKGIQYNNIIEGPHIFVIAYTTADRLTNTVSTTLEKFNDAQWKDLKLNTSNLIFNDDKTITLVAEFTSRAAALSYFDKFLAQIANSKPLSNYKFYSFVITKDNFQTFYKTKALDEYLTFFDKNYQKHNQ